MNAANEEAVSAFLNERICLTEIPQVIEAVMNRTFKSACKGHSNHPQSRSHARLAAVAAIEKLAKAAV